MDTNHHPICAGVRGKRSEARKRAEKVDWWSQPVECRGPAASQSGGLRSHPELSFLLAADETDETGRTERDASEQTQPNTVRGHAMARLGCGG